MNLDPSEEKVVHALVRQCGGKAWVSRKELEGEFGCPQGVRDSSERRTLDRTLGRLIDRGIIVCRKTPGKGSVYAFTEAARNDPFLADFAASCHTRGKTTVTVKVPVRQVSEAEMEAEIQKLKAKPEKKHWEKVMLDKFEFERELQKKRLQQGGGA